MEVERGEHCDEEYLVDDPVSKGERIDLRALFDDSEPEPDSWKGYLRDMLSPYLDEYPFLRGDIDTLKRLDEYLQAPLQPPEWVYAMGVFDLDVVWSEEERDRQIREILEQTKLKHISKNQDM